MQAATKVAQYNIGIKNLNPLKAHLFTFTVLKKVQIKHLLSFKFSLEYKYVRLTEFRLHLRLNLKHPLQHLIIFYPYIKDQYPIKDKLLI